MFADFWEAGRNVFEQLGDYFSRFFIVAGEKALELVAVFLDWVLSAAGVETLGGIPEGGTLPGYGDPVTAAAWRPWMHLHLPIEHLRFLDAWFPLREAVGAIAIVLGVLSISMTVRLTSRLFFKR